MLKRAGNVEPKMLVVVLVGFALLCIILFAKSPFLNIYNSIRVPAALRHGDNLQNEREIDDRYELEEDGYDSAVDAEADASNLKYITNIMNERSVAIESGTKPSNVNQVCVVGKNPRQGSIFMNNLLHLHGSGMFNYTVHSQSYCLAKGNKGLFKVLMVPFTKCCTSMSDTKGKIKFGLSRYDVVIVTGDEFCSVNEPSIQFRQYYSSNGLISQFNVSKFSFPYYMPLGPRSEFILVEDSERQQMSSRKYLFNFAGSLSSKSRKDLQNLLADDAKIAAFNTVLAGKTTFVHCADKWAPRLTTSNGYITPQEYRNVLLDSVFTLCPSGHNPEAYRIFEACEAGSIPILALDEFYHSHACKDAFKPFIDAPFIWLNDWSELNSFFEKLKSDLESDPMWLDKREQQVRAWYRTYMHQFSLQFEHVLTWRHSQRLELPSP